jgi:hypothetical protein
VDTVDNPVDIPLPLDGLPDAPPRHRVAPRKGARRKPIYRRVPNIVHRCDDCMANHRDNVAAPLALPGRYERRIIGEGARFLCYEHVQHWREYDSMQPLEE